MFLVFSGLLAFLLSLSARVDSSCPMFSHDWASEEPIMGDYYPPVLFCVIVHNKAHTLPYFLGSVDELDYPKDRLHWFIRVKNGTDNSAEMLSSWIKHIRPFYGTVDFDVYDGSLPLDVHHSETGTQDEEARQEGLTSQWHDDALFLGRSLPVDFIFFLDCDVLLTNPKTLRQLMTERVTIIAPMLHSASQYSNFWEAVDTDGSYVRSGFYESLYTRQKKGVFPVSAVSSAILVDLNGLQQEQLDFKLVSKDYSNFTEDVAVLVAAQQPSDSTQIYLLNKEIYGYMIPPAVKKNTLYESHENMRHLALEILTNATFDLKISSFFENNLPSQDKLGFDQIYIINLKRRPERRRRMLTYFQLLGINATVIDAVDGKMLTMDDLKRLKISQLKDYKDPYYKRPMTMGEIGCFLSHFHIWQDVVKQKYEKVVVFEDDILLVHNFRQRLEAAMAELEHNAIYWDLVYLGRKQLNVKDERVMVPNCRYVRYVGYSYWTLAYALTLRGARKLLEAEPLQRLVPVDEYLPIMFDQHPELLWKKEFRNRNLKALTTEPLLVFPMRYTGDDGYISDTESAEIIDPTKIDHGSRLTVTKNEL